MNSNLNHSYTTKYSIDSSLEPIENDRYCQKIKGSLYLRDVSGGNTKHLVGKLTGKKILLDEAFEGGWNTYPIFDIDADAFEIGKLFLF